MWDQRYEEPGFAYGKNPNDFLKMEFIRILKGGRVLCLAEGEGRNAVFLASKGFSVTAVDQSIVGLRKAEAYAHEHGVSIITEPANLEEFDLGNDCWDAIISIAAHVPSEMRKKLHSRIASSLKTNGIFILEAYTEKQLEMEGVGGPPPAQKDMFMSLIELQIELEGLDIVIGQEIEKYVSEGKYHRGQSAVVQIVAQKL